MSFANRELTKSIKEDHDELREFHQKYLDAKSNNEEREKWANQFRWELARHSVGEEIVWYPELERVLGAEGKKAADHDRAEHQKSKEDLAKLETLSVSDPQFAIVFAKLFKDLEHHMEEEERDDLPKFEAKITDEDSARISKSFERTKKFVPTRSHPGAPNKPPFETVAGLMAAPIDKLRDMFAKFPDN